MINFVVKEEKKNTELDRIRRLVMGVTTAILVMYIVAAAGMIGWKWYWEGKATADQKDLNGLTEQIVAKSTTEVLIRKLAARSKTTKNFLDSRLDVYQSAVNLSNNPLVTINKWNYESLTKQSADLAASSTAVLADISKQLSEKYTTAQINQTGWSKEFGWVTVVRLGGSGK